MDYEDAMEATVSRKEAKAEIKAHSLSFYDFTADCGDKDEYKSRTVLEWLGY